MRYAEGPSVEVEVVVAAPPALVWSLVSDIDLPARFSTEFRGGSWLDAPGVGARFTGRNHHDARGDWETVCYVSRYDPPHAFSWEVTDPQHPSASWWFDLHESADGVTVRYGARIGPAPSGLTTAIAAMPDKEERIVARRLQELEGNMRATLQGIKALAEEGR